MFCKNTINYQNIKISGLFFAINDFFFSLLSFCGHKICLFQQKMTNFAAILYIGTFVTQNNNGNNLVKWLVIGADFAILNLLIIAFMTFWPSIMPPIFAEATKITFFVANTTLLIAELYYSTIIHVRKIPFYYVIQRTFLLTGMESLFFFLSMRLWVENGGGLFRFGIIFFISFFFIVLLSRVCETKLLRYIRSLGYNTRTVLFVGNDPAVLEMYEQLIEDPAAGYRVSGYFADAEIENAPKEFKRLGNLKELDKMIDDSINNTICGNPIGMEEVLCCLSHDESKEVYKIIQFCDKNVIHFYYLPRKFSGYRVHLDPLTHAGVNVYTNHIEPLSYVSNRIRKRAFDVAVSSIACICILPFLPIIALCIKLQSPGPVFFSQERTGINGKVFRCYKFRSMHVNSDADKAQATKDDPRKFAFGNFMRKTNIDELPQFFNVLKGDMSIVGPRPHMLFHTETYGALIDKYMVRHFSKPGITGWAQVTGYRGETKELWEMEERIKRDIWYIENWTFWLDIRIIILTAKSIFFPDKNAY